jgi:ketosteroid isomerase-like protein
MKKTIFALSLLISFGLYAQKKNIGGKIYDKHPSIQIVDEFTKAFVAGDEQKMKELVTDDFEWWQMNVMEPKAKGIKSLISRSKYFSSNITGFKVENRGKAYSDAIEFKGANRVDVYTYRVLSGIDKNTGVILQIPRNEIFRLTKDGSKIKLLSVGDSQLKWQKTYDAYNTSKNGVIYKDHPFISKARLLYANIGTGDTEAMRALYADNARIFDVMNSDVNTSISADEEIENFKGFLKEYEVLRVIESGYPDLLEYRGTETKTVISWWDLIIKNRKSGKIKKHSQHSQLVINKEGLITRELYYFNTSQLPK